MVAGSKTIDTDTNDLGRIRQLDTSLINKIAAGEVIERPASVVKELLENSLDALSTRIDVDLEEAGATLIRIVDDGEGIHPDDLLLAVSSHATSKIRHSDDLFRVQTMGFRGEALASVAEVSDLRIRTKRADQPNGRQLHVVAGKYESPQVCGCPDGTQIEVRELFLNTPVRRKFLKSQGTELSHITEQFSRIALANPRLAMTLRHNGKLLHELPATDSFLERLIAFFGKELAGQLIPVESEHNGLRMWGFVGHPDVSKSARKHQYFFLNGRWIQDRSLQHALTESYRGLLMVGRQPISYLMLELPPDEVDVNVHPQKSEVRFVDSQRLYRQLLGMIRQKFLTMNLEAKYQFPTSQSSSGAMLTAVKPSNEDLFSGTPPQQLRDEFAGWAKSQLSMGEGSSEEQVDLGPRPSQEGWRPSSIDQASYGRYAEFKPFPELGMRTAHPVEQNENKGSSQSAGSTPEQIATGTNALQVDNCYLVVPTGDGLTVIDQHALHERILYERLRERVLAGKIETQRLLVPTTVVFSPQEHQLLMDHAEMLGELGFQIEDFGGHMVAMTSYPVMLRRKDLEQLLKDIVETLRDSNRKIERRELIDHMLHSMACKAAVKSGDRLTENEIQSLLAQRHLIDDAHHCPHGRPTMLRLTKADLDKQFGRLG